MAGQESSSSVKSAMRTLDLLELLMDQGRPMAAAELASALEIPMSSLSYLLGTLVERGYLARDGRHYAIGHGIRRLWPKPPPTGLADHVAPIVRLLRRELNEFACFFILSGYEVETLVTDLGSHALQYRIEVGQRGPIHSFAGGKALLASFTPDELDRYLDAGPRERFTPGTLTGEEEIRAEVAAIRARGIARAFEEHTIGVVALGRAAEHAGQTVGAFSVAIPTPRFSEELERQAERALRRASDALAAAMA